MDYATQKIEQARERGKRRGKASQTAQRNERLAAALNFQPLENSFQVLEVSTRNARTGQLHYLEVRHDDDSSPDRFSVYVDGKRWRNGWSRSRFCAWLFRQIDSVRREWR
ncbi:MAG: hypothetical protein K9M45_12810 [Kiritimatiellales bacterium]|nr:hypothetical protein [Kiritimatiellales bacterium]